MISISSATRKWARGALIDAALVVEKTLTLSYHPDGNLNELREHHPRIEGRQDESTTVTSFERYDAGTNVDGFSLLHPEFFAHLFLIPGVQLQKGNPGREIRTGDGINYVIDYAYVYDESGRPMTKLGQGTFSSGPNAGRPIQTRSEFSYY